MFSNSSILIFTDLDGTLLNRDTFKFDSIKPFLKELKNKNICMEGYIETYRGRPQIFIFNENQIKIIE